MYAKDGDAAGLDVNDEACCRARRTDCVPGMVEGGTKEWSSVVNRGGGCAAPEAGCGATASDEESVQFELLSTSD
jgi:hypothetical protein